MRARSSAATLIDAMSAFEEATAIRAGDVPDVYAGTIPDRWQQGKGAFGGIVIALLARAMLAGERDAGRSLRSLSADLCAPALPGDVELRVAQLRRGASVSFVEAHMFQAGERIARGSATLATARAIPPTGIHGLPPFSPPTRRPPWRDVEPLPVRPPIGPVFADKYEYRSTGALPFASGKEPTAEGWLREKETPSVLDEAAIVGMLDAWWPTVLAVESSPRAVATVGYTMQLVVDPRTLDPAEPLFYRARGTAGADNFFIEMRELWSGDAVVALNQQTFAVLT